MNSSLFIIALCLLISDSFGLLFPKPKTTAAPKKYSSCADLWAAGYRTPGIYYISWPTRPAESIPTYCNNNAAGPQTVVLLRNNGYENFYRGIADYTKGFGNAQNDYWFGLQNMASLIQQGYNILTVTAQDWSGNTRTARYNIALGNAPGYKLSVSGYSGNLPDDLSYQNGRDFYTYDKVDPNGCATGMKGGWWYNYCAYALPTGIHYTSGTYPPNPSGKYDGIFWKDWLGYNYSLKYVAFTLGRV